MFKVIPRPHGHPLNLKMMASPSTSASPQPQPSKNEIETFNRQYVPIFVFLLSFANVGILWWQVETNFMDIPYSTVNPRQQLAFI